MQFDVTAEAKYTYRVEAPNEEEAIERAMELFAASQHENPITILEWSAREAGKPAPSSETMQQATIEAAGHTFTVTRIPTATSGSWFTVHDAFEVWGAVAIDDLSGEVIGWRNPPPNSKEAIEKAIKEAFGIPVSG